MSAASRRSVKGLSLILVLIVILGAAFSLPVSAASKMILNKSSMTLDIGQNYKIIAFDTATGASVVDMKYASSDTKIVTVSAKGIVKGIQAGSATIVVKDVKGNRKAYCKITVSSKKYSPPAAIKESLSLSASSATVYKGCHYQLFATSNTTVTFSSSNSSVASVNAGGIVTGIANGTAVITAKTATLSQKCTIKVITGRYVHISDFSASMSAGKTLLLRSGTSGVTWSSSNTKVAVVSGGYVVAKKAGYAVITALNGYGKATCLVAVSAAAPIRFAYCSPNCAAKGQKVSFIAITDKYRTAVCYRIYYSNGTYKTVKATSRKTDGNTYVWTGYGSFSAAGTYAVVAYSKYNNKWKTCTDGATTAFVANSKDTTTTVCTARRASDEVISLISTFEGFLSDIYDDPWTGDPTIGYGRVIFSGQTFYNHLTKREAFAYLVQTVNNDGYATKMNDFLVGNKVKFNQQQFDALVCLVYNTGTGVVTGDAEVRNALLDCDDGSGSKVVYYVNGTDVRLRKGAGTNTAVVKTMTYGTVLTIVEKANTSWYKVKLKDGTVGYIKKDFISKKKSAGKLDLRYVNRQNLINKICQYHHAGGQCVYGLLYRRVDEMEMFFYGDYNPCYGRYKYNIHFTCAVNPSVHT